MHKHIVLALSLVVAACNTSTTNEPHDASSDAVDGSNTGPSCSIAGSGSCAVGATCVAHTCANGTTVSCTCSAVGALHCEGACEAPASDASAICDDASDAIDEFGPAPNVCVLPDGSYCPPGNTCFARTCADGAGVSCTCDADGTVHCAEQCPVCLPMGGDCRGAGGAVCCEGLSCQQSSGGVTCQPAGCAAHDFYCCDPTMGQHDPVCEGGASVCPAGTTRSNTPCMPGPDV